MSETKKSWFDLKTLTIIALIIIVFLMRMCSSDPFNSNGGSDNVVKINGKKYTIVKRVVDTAYVPVYQTLHKPGDTIYVEVPIYIGVPADVDTAEILKDYFAKYVYKDTLRLKDSLGYIAIRDTIFKNRILDRFYDAKVNKIIVKETVFLDPVKRLELYLGGVIGFDKVDIINFAGPSAMLKDKKDRVYSIGIGYNNAKAISVQAGMYWKLKFKN